MTAKMRLRSVAIVSQVELDAMPTRALLARLQRLRECEESAECSDLNSVEITAATGIVFKADPNWSEAYNQVRVALSSREHIPR